MPLGREIDDPGTLSAGRVAVRIIRWSDAEPLRALLTENRSWLQRWEATHPSGRSVVPGSVSMRPMVRTLRKQLRAGSGMPFVVLYDGAVVGQLSVSEISGGALQSSQIGYWVSEHVAGRGVTTTAAALVIDHLFGALGLHRVEVCIRPENDASLRVVAKLGLRHEGSRTDYIHIDGAWRDHEVFVALRGETPSGYVARLAQR
ncbi:GNAT family N-acetyltransferase [Leucobacter chromiiresistens]|uniref:GNAT family N-acetyltransferase n=1 Tax=Leucobacter chromiiresistens TaxID=1079994 RepID=UPI00073435D1|nr:GNAT family protein [Leucobacter chromiiresistens]